MADIVLSTVDLTVFGGPTSLDVSVDVGQTGARGSLFWAASQIPSTYTFPDTIKLQDLYLNTATSGAYAGWIYQYNLQVGNPEWVPILQVVPSQYSAISSSSFGVSGGATTITVPMSTLTGSNITDKTKFIIRYNIESSTQIATGFTYSISGTYPNKNIDIVIKAASWNGTTWSEVTGTYPVHLFMTYKA